MKEIKDSKITFRLTEEEKAYLQQKAEKTGITMSKLIRQIIEKYMEGGLN